MIYYMFKPDYCVVSGYDFYVCGYFGGILAPLVCFSAYETD